MEKDYRNGYLDRLKEIDFLIDCLLAHNDSLRGLEMACSILRPIMNDSLELEARAFVDDRKKRIQRKIEELKKERSQLSENKD